MPPKKDKKAKKAEVVVVEESEYDTMDLEMLREVVPMLRAQLEKSMMDRNYVQLERDSIQQYFDITRREVRELELAITAKDREMELLDDNHRVELRVYQQKVKHLEYEHRNSIKTIIQDGTGLLEVEQSSHEEKERDLLRMKEQIKFDQMQLELVNTQKVAEVRQQHEKQLIKLRQQFEDGLDELTDRSDKRLRLLETDLELRRRVEVHEMEERKNQHINDLIMNHNKAFTQMKAYYNDITSGNLKLIQNLKKQILELEARKTEHAKLLQEYTLSNQKLSIPLAEVSTEIAELQTLLKERTKEQQALHQAASRLSTNGKDTTTMRMKYQMLEDEYGTVERERDCLYSSFEESIQRVTQQSEFQNQALEQRLIVAESNVGKASLQVEEIIRAANMDSGEVARMMTSLNQMLAVKEEVLTDVRFEVVVLQKRFNDTMEVYIAKMKELGIPEEEVLAMGFNLEPLSCGATNAPVVGLSVYRK